MSGIIGLLNLDGAPADAELLARQTQLMAARGPDGQATWSEGAIGLGHALLRTTFESAHEAQPCTLDGSAWITADARIDGREALMAELRGRGRAPDNTRPDVELILQAYAAWGTKCVEHLIGDFAFAIWDTRERRLFCARDQLGLKPFFYAQHQRTLAFSSSLDCLLRLPGFSAELNEQALADFLLFRSNQDPTTTTYAGIRRLAPAHTLTVADSALKTARYWQLPEHPAIEFRSEAETVARFKSLFDQAVGDRLRTERVGMPMSGGMDSSSVAVVAQHWLGQAGLLAGARPEAERGVRAFTVTQDTSNPQDEAHYAKLVAQHAHLSIEYLPSEGIVPDELDRPARPKLEPGVRSSAETENGLSRSLARYSRVALTGLGGDPLLYPSHTFVLELLRRGRWIRLARVMAQQVRRTGSLPPLYLRAELKRRLGRTQTLPPPTWLNPEFEARLALRDRWQQWMARNAPQDQRRDMAELPYWSNLLAAGDPGYTGLPHETRHPFFDLRLLNFMLTVPPVPWLVNKALLREAMRDLLPEAVRMRPKTPLAARPDPAEPRPAPEWPARLAASPELAAYVDTNALLRIIRQPAKAAVQDQITVGGPLALADWLQSQKS
ncbi:MAG: asparagine synthase-related protein [Anaerolineales bacterium]